jgi:Cu(I)/Ag(I) efflux system membrane fusion protein
VLSGLREGETVVASSQFLLDSEASLAGLQPRRDAPASAAAPALYQGRGRVEQITPTSVTLSHGAIPTLQGPAMTMKFRLVDPALARGVKRGDDVEFAFDQPPDGPTVRRLTPARPQ